MWVVVMFEGEGEDEHGGCEWAGKLDEVEGADADPAAVRAGGNGQMTDRRVSVGIDDDDNVVEEEALIRENQLCVGA